MNNTNLISECIENRVTLPQYGNIQKMTRIEIATELQAMIHFPLLKSVLIKPQELSNLFQKLQVSPRDRFKISVLNHLGMEGRSAKIIERIFADAWPKTSSFKKSPENAAEYNQKLYERYQTLSLAKDNDQILLRSLKLGWKDRCRVIVLNAFGSKAKIQNIIQKVIPQPNRSSSLSSAAAEAN